MPGDAFKKVQAGQPLSIPAAAWNACLDAARDVQSRQSSIGRTALSGNLEPDTILVRNDTGSARERFEVVGLGDPVFTPDESLAEFQIRIAFAGLTPEQKHRGRFALLLEPVPAGGFARALVSGVTPCQVEFDGDGDCRWADIEPNTYRLHARTDRGTAQILWSSGICRGLHWAVVRLSNVPTQLAEPCKLCTTTTLPPCENGTCTWEWDNDEQVWNLASQNCRPTTTTTTTDPGTTTTSGDPNTTTTLDPHCRCHEPQYCGEFDCEITRTMCTRGEPQDQPNCTGTTSTTTTSSTTTTTPDPNTTTTTCPPPDPTSTTLPPPPTTEPPCAGCDWFCSPIYGWILVSNQCVHDPTCGGCPFPVGGCSGNCSTAHTPCIPPPPPPPPPPPFCIGRCQFTCDGLGNWHQTWHGCLGNIPCSCTPPTVPCTVCASTVTVPCSPPPPPPTTTTLPPPPPPPPPPPDPCAPPPPTTTPGPTTTSTSTTSTTPNCDSASCYWRWNSNAGSWSLVDDECPSDCPCENNVPPYDGFDCETAQTVCGLTTTSTTTSTSTTSTTTTCTPNGQNGCTWGCNPSTGQWFISEDTCCDGCSGAPPTPCSGTQQTACQTTTTTTDAPCIGQCSLEIDEFGVWHVVSSNCVGCDCPTDHGLCGPGTYMTINCDSDPIPPCDGTTSQDPGSTTTTTTSGTSSTPPPTSTSGTSSSTSSTPQF